MTRQKFYPITSLCKQDIIYAFADLDSGKTKPEVINAVNNLTEADMNRIASRMADAYLEHSFWSDLKLIFEFTSKEKGGHTNE